MVLEIDKNEYMLIREIQRDLDIIIAALLLTGQITVTRVFFGPGYFGVTVGGPLTGARRLEGKDENQLITMSIDIMDIILAILLIKDEINLVGVFFSSDARFSLSISGPIFGRHKVVPVLSYLRKNQKELNNIVRNHFQVNQELVQILKTC